MATTDRRGQPAAKAGPAKRASGPRERTRRALVAAAQELLRTGRPLTVPSVAEAAGVSRATAYRYFPNNESVVLNATLPLGNDPLQDAGWVSLADGAPADLPARAAELVRIMGRWAFDHEAELRTMLHLSLAPGGSITRRGLTNRKMWIASLLEGLPDDVSPESRRRLAAALIPLFGADAVVWSTDIAELDRAEAVEVMAWTAATLVAATLAGTGPTG